MDHPNINKVLIESMILAQKEKPTNKKEYVLLLLRSTLSQDIYERYEPLIIMTIDTLKEISKNPRLLKGLKNNKCRCINI